METRAAKRLKMEFEQLGKTSILHLNDDCLLEILSYVKVWDLLATELVCKRFNYLTRETYKTFKVLNLYQRAIIDGFRFTTEDVVKMFRRVGPYVHTLKLSSDAIKTQGGKPPQYISKYCKNLHTVYLKRFTSTEATSKKLSPAFKNVKSVYLDWCRVHDMDLDIMFDLEEITVLHLTSCDFVCGLFLLLLKNIQNINLMYSKCYPNFNPNIFIDFCKNNKQLRSLSICGCKWIEQNCLRSIERNLKNLECLKLNSEYKDVPYESYVPLMDLPKITHLELTRNYEDTAFSNKLLLKIAAHNRLEYLDMSFYDIMTITQVLTSLTKLKKLKIGYCSPNVTDKTLELLSCTGTLEELDISSSKITSLGLEKLIERCKNIRYIDLRFCKSIMRDFADFIPNILKHLKGRRQKLLINVAFTKICENGELNFEEEVYEVMFHSHLLKIMYDHQHDEHSIEI